ncbi:M24 family metallopeptidase [Desulfogranum japonicum]|uniref:M24 family metallopeptidase n=1 Tax=Desulfogranum japonicum TaxID=231447 RepID=UPI0003F4E50A|nr:Xaa-Pro peptidase family protein [Desulfogranum japonicum]
MGAKSLPSTRIARLQAKLKRKKFDAVLISQPDNRRYLSGYTAKDHGIQEPAGFLLIPANGKPYLLTDSRFTLQAEQETSGFEIAIYTKGLIKLLKKLLPQIGVQRLAFESHYTLHSTHSNMLNMGRKISLELVPTKDMLEKMRLIKTEEELALIRESTRINEQVFQSVYLSIEPGMTEQEVALAIDLTMKEMGAEGPSFETIVAFGPNAAKPHAVPGDTILQSGDIVLIDMGLIYKGYCSDMTRTFVAGKPDNQYLERHRLVRKAQLAGIAALKPGVTGQEVDQAARKIFDDAGYGKAFQHSLGHGVGVAVHEEPRLSPLSQRTLKPGMVVTIEPGMYIPEWGGIRLENIAIVTPDGCEVINKDTTCLDL